MSGYPALGGVTLLVYRECEHGCWCATGEAAAPPLCSSHGEPMLPGGGPKGMYDEPGRRRLGFVALFGHESAVEKIRGAVERWTGLLSFSREHGWELGPHDRPRQARYFHEREIGGFAQEHGLSGPKVPVS